MKTATAHSSAAGKILAGKRQLELVAGRVIPCLGVNRERRESSRSAQFNLDLPPPRVVSFVAWSIAEHILVSQLHADFCRDIRKIFQSLNRKHAAPGHLRNLAEERGAFQFFGRPVAR